MKNEFVPYDIALSMKGLGFNEPCIAWWFKERLLMLGQYENTFPAEEIEVENNNIEIKRQDFDSDDQFKDYLKSCSAPLYQQAFRWFREKHNLTTHIQWNVGGIWDYTVEKSIPRGMLDMSPTRYMVGLKTYEEAELACLRKLIEIVKEK